MTTSSLPSLLQRFFTERLITQQGVSPHTVAGYRDTFRLLFRFTTTQLHRAPSALRVEDLDAPFLERFLEHLERDRRNQPRTRNHRLAALHGFFRYVALAEPGLSLQCQRILAIPSKRFERGPVEFLTEDETAALIAAPNAATWVGQRDRTAAPDGLADRVTEQRDHRSAATGCRAGRWRARALLGERPQVSVHALAPGCDRRLEGMARTTPRCIR